MKTQLKDLIEEITVAIILCVDCLFDKLADFQILLSILSLESVDLLFS